MKKIILGTGLSGLVGTRIIEVLKDRYLFEDLSYDTGFDITHSNSIKDKIRQSGAEYILHLAAKADVDGCELDKSQGTNGVAWKINVAGTKNVTDEALKTNKRVIFISTDFVFDGKNDDYDEESQPHPINWYGMTKYEGEKLVLQHPQNCIVRIAYPYNAVCKTKKDFLHSILGKLSQKEEFEVLDDHYFTPTFIDDIARALEKLIESGSTGVYHVVGSSFLTPFEAANQVAQVFGFDKKLIKPVSISKYYHGRAERPYKLRLKNDKITSLGVKMSQFSEGIDIIKKQGIVI